MSFGIRLLFSPEPILKLMSTLKGNESLVYSAIVLWRLNISEVKETNHKYPPDNMYVCMYVCM